MVAYLLLLVAVLHTRAAPCGVVELYRRHRRPSLLWRAASLARDARPPCRPDRHRLLPDHLRLPLQLSLAGLRDHLGVVRGGHGARLHPPAQADRLSPAGPRARSWDRHRSLSSPTMASGPAVSMAIRTPSPGSEPATWPACPFIAAISSQLRLFSALRSAFPRCCAG